MTLNQGFYGKIRYLRLDWTPCIVLGAIQTRYDQNDDALKESYQE